MTIWQILTGRLKKYENLANFDNETEKKYENLAGEVLDGSTRFSYFFCHVYEGFFIFTKISYFSWEEEGLECLEGWEEEGSVNR